tara:strand:- start:670 stop:1167 length:498 start_codon:yes stop_codon:yes gene_type:complete
LEPQEAQKSQNFREMKNIEMNMRRADLSDLAVVAQLFDEYRVFYRKESDLLAATAFIRERIEKGESVIYLVEVEGNAAGFVQLYPSFSSVSMTRIWVLNDLYVNSVYRSLGVGRALMDRAELHCREAGAARLDLGTERSNTLAQGLYKSCGYEREDGFYFYSKTV